jgi:hypothetical protein
MDDCKVNEKSSGLQNTSFSSINNILNILLSAFSLTQKPANRIPPALLLVGAKLKPGMSPRNLAANMMSKLESEAGIPVGDAATYGEQNPIAAFSLISAKEIVGHIQDNANVQGAIAPSGINIMATGANAGGPIIVQGTNIGITSFNSNIQ